MAAKVSEQNADAQISTFGKLPNFCEQNFE